MNLLAEQQTQVVFDEAVEQVSASSGHLSHAESMRLAEILDTTFELSQSGLGAPDMAYWPMTVLGTLYVALGSVSGYDSELSRQEVLFTTEAIAGNLDGVLKFARENSRIQTEFGSWRFRSESERFLGLTMSNATPEGGPKNEISALEQEIRSRTEQAIGIAAQYYGWNVR